MVLAGYTPSEPLCLPFLPTRFERGSRCCWTYLRKLASLNLIPRLVNASTIWTAVNPSACAVSIARSCSSSSTVDREPPPALAASSSRRAATSTSSPPRRDQNKTTKTDDDDTCSQFR